VEERLDRRGFLRSTAGGVLAVAAASVVPAGCARDYPQAGTDGVTLRSLSPKEYATARAAAEALLADVPVPATRVAAGIDAELAVAGEPMKTDVTTVLRLIEHMTLLGGHRRRFTQLSVPDRLSYLDTWAHSRFKLRRGAYQALQGFVRYFAYIDDDTRPITGFQGAWPERFALPVTPVDFGEVT
jgi:hypothetical protein